MDFENDQSAKRKGMKDMPSDTDIDYENDNDETLKKLGRQTEV
ncbi:MAG TPA: hypothetical protein VEA58_08850 [Anaerovoracaceae bacterium]|nr:hypothetical protein [Anaerovoracaceae bacterium]